MTVALAEVHVVAAAAAQGRRAARGAAVPSRGGSGASARPTGCGRRGPMGRAPRPGQRDAAAGEDARTLWSWMLLEQLAQDVRYGLRGDGQEPDVHGAGRPVARARHRREHGDLQLHGRDPAALAAGRGSGIARRGEVAEQAGQLRRRAIEFVLHSIDGSTYRDRSGVTAAHLPVPGVRAAAGSIGAGPVQPLRAQAGRARECDGQWRGRARAGRVRLRRLLSRPRGRARGGPPDRCRRRSRRRRAGRGPEPGLQPAALRRAPPPRSDSRFWSTTCPSPSSASRRRSSSVWIRPRRRGLSPDARQPPLRPPSRTRGSSTRTTTGSR